MKERKLFFSSQSIKQIFSQFSGFLYRLNRKIIVVIIFVFLALFLIFFRQNKEVGETYILKPIDIDYTILASCTISDPGPYEITAISGGEIKKIFVNEGSEVKKDEMLVQIDDYIEQQELSISINNLEALMLKIKHSKENELPRLKEQLNQDAAALANAKSYLSRIENIDKVGATTDVELDQASNNYKQALGKYNQTRIQLDSYIRSGTLAELDSQRKILVTRVALAEKAVIDKKIRAPYDGTITKISINEGELIKPDSPVLTIIEKKEWVVEVNVDQRELPYLAVSQPAHVILDAYPAERIDAEVIRICSGIDIAKGSCILKLRIAEDKPFIKYGMTGNAEIYARKYRNVLAVPSRFVERTSIEGYVSQVEMGKIKIIKVDFFELGENWIILKNIPENTILSLPARN